MSLRGGKTTFLILSCALHIADRKYLYIITFKIGYFLHLTNVGISFLIFCREDLRRWFLSQEVELFR